MKESSQARGIIPGYGIVQRAFMPGFPVFTRTVLLFNTSQH